MTRVNALRGVFACAATLVIAAPERVAAQSMSLEQALRVAEQQSEALGIARTGVSRADGELLRARSQALPQINGSLGYTRTLRSQFQDFGGGGGFDTASNEPPPPPGPCDAYLRDPSATTAERLAGLEDASRCALGINPFSGFDQVGFGAKNQYNIGLSLSQPIFNGGRVSAVNHVAAAGKRVAEIELTAQRAQLRLDVTQAYFDAALSDRLVQIAESSLVQTQAVFVQVELARQVGNQSEFELLRARVSRDNQRPIVLQRRTDRDLAYLRLKQLLQIPAESALQLTTGIQDGAVATPGAAVASGDTSAVSRSTVRQAAEAVEVQRGLLKVQRSQRLPDISLTSQYGRVAFPSGGFPKWGDFRTNWTVGVGLQMPLFTGGRIRGDETVARANLAEAELRLQQASEFASLDARAALSALAQAEASWEASAGTAEQASRAYTIAEVRYEEGISTQIELSDARLLMQQAQINRALAARDLQVARVRITLLRDLPLGGGSAQPQTQQLQQQQPQQQRNAQPAGQTTGGFTGQPGGENNER